MIVENCRHCDGCFDVMITDDQLRQRWMAYIGGMVVILWNGGRREQHVDHYQQRIYRSLGNRVRDKVR